MRTLVVQSVVLLVIATAAAGPEHPQRPLRRNEAYDPSEVSSSFWHEEAKAGIQQRLNRKPNVNVARNVIMFLGDGMSIPTLAAARTLMGQRNNKTGEETQMFMEAFPTVGLSKTYCLDEQIADSACTATAYLCGVKNNYGTTGVTGNVRRGDCLSASNLDNHLESIADWALAYGRDAGIVTTTRITHASPSGTYAKTANRDWENDAAIKNAGFDPNVCPDIAHQLVHSYPGTHFKVILGGGRREFIPTTTVDEENSPGRRGDDRNLIEEWQQDKVLRNLDHRYVWNRTELMSLMSSPPEYLLGLFEGNHMQYHLQADKEMEPTLTELTEIAIRSLSRNEKGFFLFVESGRIDHAHHDNFVNLALDETIQMDLAIKRATELLGVEDTLIVVTADHAHVMAFNGYTSRGGDILGRSDKLGDDGIPYMTLSYINGPGARTPENNARTDVTKEANYRDLNWPSHAEIILDSETHGGDDVAVFATGPYHHMFSGLYEQSQIPHIMAFAACIGPGLTACNSPSGANLLHPLSLPLYLLALIVLLARFNSKL